MSNKKPHLQRTMSAAALRALVDSCDEDTVHLAVVDHLRKRLKPGVFWMHVPNGGLRNMLVAKKLKAMGTRAGVPDLLLVFGGRLHALELKTTNGRRSTEQVQVMTELDAAGAVTAVGKGVDQAVSILESWGVLR